MEIGYIRVSTNQQNFDMQEKALLDLGCERIYSDVASGTSREGREGLENCLKALRPDDKLIVWKIDRLGRSIYDLINIVNQLKNMNVHIISLQDGIDTRSLHGQLLFTLFALLAEFEYSFTRERTHHGRENAKLNGVKFGAPIKITKKVITNAIKLYEDGSYPVAEICSMIKISKSSLYKILRENKITSKYKKGIKKDDK